jgi:hypothetical protein
LAGSLSRGQEDGEHLLRFDRQITCGTECCTHLPPRVTPCAETADASLKVGEKKRKERLKQHSGD